MRSISFCTMFTCVTFIIITVLNFCAGQHIITANDYLEFSVLHFNDFHARFEETDEFGNTCKNKTHCIGGFSRLYKQISEIVTKKPDTIVLNAGDSFQGTLWYTVGKWNITQEFINKLPLDAEVLGNHDFDDGIEGVVPYIKNLNHTIVATNIDDSLEPSIQNTYSKSKVIVRDGKKIGIIGVIINTCDQLANTGKLKFYLESPSVNAEAERLVKEEGVFTNIILSHAGYDTDIKIAENASERISLIVGGHSHTFLFTGDNAPGVDTVAGEYPTVVQSKYGHNVLVVQASVYSRYLGNITVYLDENGKILDFTGSPIYLSNDLPQDETINAQLQPWKDIVDLQGPKVIGSTLVLLGRSNCYISECALGNFVADAMVSAYINSAPEGTWTESALAMTNAGGLRANLEIGDITYNDMVVSQPFANTLDAIDIKGKYLKEFFEHTATSYEKGDSRLNLVQVSGFRINYNLNIPVGDRVRSIKVRCQNCTIPKYNELKENEIYTIILNSFMLKDVGRYRIITQNMMNRRVGPVDIDVLVNYLSYRSPVFQEVGNRLIFST